MDYEKIIKDKIIKIKANLFTKNAYLGMVVNSVEYEFTNNVNTLATDGKKIYLNVNFCYENLNQLEYLIIHEALHIIFLHNFLNKKFSKEDMILLNVAEDIIINEYILKELNHKFHNGIYKEMLSELKDKDVIKMNSLEIYDILKQNAYINQSSNGGGNNGNYGSGKNNGNDGDKSDNKNKSDGELSIEIERKLEKIFDKLDINKSWEEIVKDEIKIKDKLSEENIEKKEKLSNEIKETLSKVVGIEKMIGNLSGLLSNIIDKQIYAKSVNWRYLLREELKDLLKNELTYRLINKKVPMLRKLGINVANLPTLTNGNYKTKLVILVDVSGSITDAEYSAFISEIEKIVKSVKCEGEVITFDVKMINKFKLRNGFANEVIKSLKNRVGYGGTNVSEALKYASKCHKGAYLVMLTDGHVNGFNKQFVKPFKKFIVVLTPNGSEEYLKAEKVKFVRMEFSEGGNYE